MNFNLVNNENLPSPPLHLHWLLEQPLPLVIIIVSVAAVATMLLASQGRRRRALQAMGVAAGLVAGLLLLARTVETDRERVSAMSREFVDRVIAADAPGVERLMDSRIAMLNDGKSIGRDRAWFLSVVSNLRGEIVRHGYTARGVLVDDPSPGSARTRFSVRTDFGPGAIVANQTVYSSWELSFSRTPSGQWAITGLECLSVLGQRPDLQWVNWGEQQIRRPR